MEQSFDKHYISESKPTTSVRIKSVWNALVATNKESKKDSLSVLAAGVAFYVFLGVFPLLAAFISLYGVFSSPDDVASAIESFSSVLPAEIVSFIDQQLRRLVSSQSFATRAAIISGFIALWSGSRAMKGVMGSLCIVNGKLDERNFFVQKAVSLLMTFGAIVLGTIVVLLLAALPAIVSFLPFGALTVTALLAARWVVLGLALTFGLGVLYRYGPDRRGQKLKLFTPGAVVATIVWLIASGGFSWFVSNFGNFNKTYGSLGAIAILLLWLFLSAYVVILGAELDVELEKRNLAKR